MPSSTPPPDSYISTRARAAPAGSGKWTSTSVAELIRSLPGRDDHKTGHRWFLEGASARPALKATVITCMDARIDLPSLVGLGLGSVHTIRNAGAVITDDVERSLALSQHLLGTTEVVLIGHTQCGAEGLKDSEFRDRLCRLAGRSPTWNAQGFPDVRQSVAEGVERLRKSPFLVDGSAVNGFILDVVTGQLIEID